MKIVFMGTPDFAVGALEALIRAGHEITAVVTQPDKPKGRGKEVQFPPVKECALREGIPVFQPVKIKTEEAISQLRQYEADIFVIVAFGQILSKEILEMPRLGSVNIHASLLPKYRGAAPIQWVIINGEKESGVTIMQMDEGIDTGDMLSKTVVPILEEDTFETLHDKLMDAGAKLIVETLPKLEEGSINPEKQNDEESCYAKILKKSFGEISWTDSADKIEHLVRGMNPWPSAYTYMEQKQLKIWVAKQEKDAVTLDEIISDKSTVIPGMIVKVEKDAIFVQTGDGILKITELQMEGKKRMEVKAFLLGYQLQQGIVLGKTE